MMMMVVLVVVLAVVLAVRRGIGGGRVKRESRG